MNEPIEVAFAPDRLAVLLKHFAELNDERESWRVAYPLKEVLLLVTCATIATCDDFDEIVLWGEHHLDFLRRFSDFHHGVPCARWLRDLMNRIDPSLFARCFESFVAAMWPQRHDFIAIDGKTARRTHDKRKGLKATQPMPGSSWDSSACRRKPTRSPPSPNCWTPSRTPANSRGRSSPSTPWDAKSTSPIRWSTPKRTMSWL